MNLFPGVVWRIHIALVMALTFLFKLRGLRLSSSFIIYIKNNSALLCHGTKNISTYFVKVPSLILKLDWCRLWLWMCVEEDGARSESE